MTSWNSQFYYFRIVSFDLQKRRKPSKPFKTFYVFQSSDWWYAISVSSNCYHSQHPFPKPPRILGYVNKIFEKILTWFSFLFMLFACYRCIKGTCVTRSDLTLSWSVMQQILVTRGCTLIWYVTHSTDSACTLVSRTSRFSSVRSVLGWKKDSTAGCWPITANMHFPYAIRNNQN